MKNPGYPAGRSCLRVHGPASTRAPSTIWGGGSDNERVPGFQPGNDLQEIAERAADPHQAEPGGLIRHHQIDPRQSPLVDDGRSRSQQQILLTRGDGRADEHPGSNPFVPGKIDLDDEGTTLRIGRRHDDANDAFDGSIAMAGILTVTFSFTFKA